MSGISKAKFNGGSTHRSSRFNGHGRKAVAAMQVIGHHGNRLQQLYHMLASNCDSARAWDYELELTVRVPTIPKFHLPIRCLVVGGY